MRIRIVYIHHNGFVLHLADRSLVFDIPSETHLPAGAAAALRTAVAGRKVLAVVSHSHADHFNPHLPGLLAGAETV
ncbi:MAG: MBL fold metallo-hydrolase, partial [Desulfovibrionaceae bacterium]